ncbi:MAG: BamA/TamA family outer membrane protein [Flavobacteriaceae bacterium]|nr:BamA/TamA family outer membrane protein [Flavobacteriaceae bacterium]
MKKIFIYFLLILFLSACSSVKRVKDAKYLLTQNTIIINDKKNNNTDLIELLVQKPNSKTLGLPLSLYFYNLGDNKKPEKASDWGNLKPKTYNFIKNVFSEKQSISFANSMIRLNNWFLKNGQAPIIIDDLKIKKTINNLTAYHKNRGYFRVEVSSNKKLLNNKKGEIDYIINTGRPTYLDSIRTKIKSPVLDSLYQSKKALSYLKSGDQFIESNFIKEAKRITNLFRNNGIYHFTENDLGYYNIDTANTNNYKTNIDLVIFDKKRILKSNGDYILKPYTIQKIRKVTVFTDYSFSQKDKPNQDSTSFKGITFLAHNKIKYNPKLLSESIFIKPGEVYADSLRNLTRKHLKSLRNFKVINIKYEPVDSLNNQLDVSILLTPLDKFSLDLETELTHSNIRDLGVSAKFSIVNRNIFKGAEIFKLSFLSSFFNASQDANKEEQFFNSWEIGADMSLEIPRFVAPFGINKLVPKRMSPRTVFSLGTSIQQNIGLDRETLTALMSYKWQYNAKKTIQLDIFNTQYVRNLRIGNYFDIYNSEYIKLNSIAKEFYDNPEFNLERQQETVSFMNTVFNDPNFLTNNPNSYRNNLNILDRYNIITSDFLIPTIAYSFTYNNQSDFRDNNFSFFKIRVANSGNIGGLLSNKKNNNNRKTIFNIPLAQYFKTDIEYKKFWEIDDSSVIGFRSFIGAIVPYDNSAIPFTKSYFAGGSNDIRAWQTYDLGPGNRNSGLEYNIGSLKFLTSAEYRFDLFGSLKGALFVDAGNIWDITNSIFAEDEAKFNGIKSVKDIAVGSGFGLRYDFSFLVFRLDLGFKMHEPYLETNKWFRNYNFSNAVYNIGINYPF